MPVAFERSLKKILFFAQAGRFKEEIKQHCVLRTAVGRKQFLSLFEWLELVMDF